ncbi:Uncharacterized oxidoreductase Mvan_2161 [Durusdinium trenchii]|uniref:Uncharacterized oxidoreductase Mvan_2161 n=1 Tax=Durusdinium trenchii TaxID=1381693 RepID=A0ABP0L102_9DINO
MCAHRLWVLWLKSLAMASTCASPSMMLSNGRQLPLVGLGCASGVRQSHVSAALEIGYRLFDTAQAYQWGYHEDEVGEAVQHMPRQEIFLQSKIHPEDLGYTSTLSAFKVSLQRLKTDYLDVMLTLCLRVKISRSSQLQEEHRQPWQSLHKPWCWPGACSRQPEGTWKDGWRALEELHGLGQALAIGICDVDMDLLEELLQQRQKPHIIQNWMDPFHQDKLVRRKCQEEGIQYQAYSTLGTQWVYFKGYEVNPVFSNLVLQEIAQFHNRTVAQVVLNWAVHRGISIIPASKDPTRQRSNFHSFDFTLAQEQMDAIDALDGALDKKGPEL